MIKKISIKLGISLLVSLSVILSSAAQAAAKSDFFTNNGFGNSVAYSPGVHHKGITYVTYQGPKENPWVTGYNHKTKKWIGPFKAGTSLLGEGKGKKIDNHGRPTLIVDNAGYIHIFFGGHGGDTARHGKNPLGNTHSGEFRHVVSKKPNDISSFKRVFNVQPFATYNQAFKMGNGDIFVFYRHGAHSSDWVYQRSTNNARTFEKPVSVLKSEKIKNPKTKTHTHNWYLNVFKTSHDRLDFAFNYHAENRPHNLERRNGYYMYMKTWGKTPHKNVKNVKGESLKLPITKGLADRKTLFVKTAKNKWASGSILTLDRNGWPHILLNEGANDGSKFGGAKKLKYYRWDGVSKKWTNNGDASLPGARGQLAVNYPRNAVLYTAGKHNNQGKFIRWKTKNGGKSFTQDKTLYNGGSGSMDMSDTIVDAHRDARYVLVDRTSSDYVNLILWGDSGIIKRTKSGASVLTKAQKAERKL